SSDLFEVETMTADQMHAIIDEHRDGPKIVPRTSVAIADDAVDQTQRATGTEQESEDLPEAADGSA
ncbi:MAG: hypothetical protein ABGZ23_21495, partial [Fuerstiella sp.]